VTAEDSAAWRRGAFKADPAFRAKLQIGASLAIQARDSGFTFRAVVADSAYSDQDRDMGHGYLIKS
jgi:hypothetical protein